MILYSLTVTVARMSISSNSIDITDDIISGSNFISSNSMGITDGILFLVLIISFGRQLPFLQYCTLITSLELFSVLRPNFVEL